MRWLPSTETLEKLKFCAAAGVAKAAIPANITKEANAPICIRPEIQTKARTKFFILLLVSTSQLYPV